MYETVTLTAEATATIAATTDNLPVEILKY